MLINFFSVLFQSALHSSKYSIMFITKKDNILLKSDIHFQEMLSPHPVPSFPRPNE